MPCAYRVPSLVCEGFHGIRCPIQVQYLYLQGIKKENQVRQMSFTSRKIIELIFFSNSY